MKKRVLISFLALSCMMLGSVTGFASDVGKDKVPKKEILSKEELGKTSFELNAMPDANLVGFDVAKSNYSEPVEKAVKVAKAEKSFNYTGLPGCTPRSCCNDNMIYIKHITAYNLKNAKIYIEPVDVWKDKIKQCRTENSLV